MSGLERSPFFSFFFFSPFFFFFFYQMGSTSPPPHKMPACNHSALWGAFEDPGGSGTLSYVKASEDPASAKRGPDPQLALQGSPFFLPPILRP